MTNKSDQAVQQPQFYKNVVALSDKGHADWKIRGVSNYAFAMQTNAVLITAVEFALAACEFPIVFIDNGGGYLPVAVLGLKSGQNLYVSGKDAEWGANYIPAYIRRYPFILSGDKSKEGETYTVCIDEAFQGFGRDDGEALFDDKGGQSKYLERIISFLKDYQAQGLATERFCKNLKKLDVLEPMQANFSVQEGEDFKVAGFLVINMEKLKAKKPLELAELIKSDEMSLVYHHLASLKNFTDLTKRHSANTSKAVA